MKENRHFSTVQTALVVALCGIFAFLALGSALLGSGVYRKAAERSERNSTVRTAAHYMTNQVRQNDTGAAYVTTFGGFDALVFSQLIDDSVYDTILYCDGQFLRELFFERGLDMKPEDGTEMLEVDALALSETDGVITMTITAAGETVTVSACPTAGISTLSTSYEEVAG